MGKINFYKGAGGERLITITNNIFKNKNIAAKALGIGVQNLSRGYEGNKYDQGIEYFINKELVLPRRFELRPYRKALCYIFEYEETITNLFRGINAEMYKDNEKKFVDNLYDCSIWDLEIYFPNENAKKERIVEFKSTYDYEQEETVKEWIKLITFYLLVGEDKAYKKRYNEILNQIKIESTNVEEVIKEKQNTFNYIFINSLYDFYPGKFETQLSSYIQANNNTQFDYLLKTNKNDSLINNEIIGILTSFNQDKTVGEILFTTINSNTTYKDMKRFFWGRINNTLGIINLISFSLALYSLTENGNYEYINTASLLGDNNDEYRDIISKSFFIIDRNDCNITEDIDKIANSIRTIYKEELEKGLDEILAHMNNLSEQNMEYPTLEGLNPMYLFNFCLGNDVTLIGDNKEVRLCVSKDDIFNT